MKNTFEYIPFKELSNIRFNTGVGTGMGALIEMVNNYITIDGKIFAVKKANDSEPAILYYVNEKDGIGAMGNIWPCDLTERWFIITFYHHGLTAKHKIHFSTVKKAN